MSPLFYVLWYSGAVVVVLLVWGRTARLRRATLAWPFGWRPSRWGSPRCRCSGRTAERGFPVGLYYLTGGSARFAAWGTATLVIASVWFLLFFAVLGLGEAWSAIRTRPGQGAV